MLTSPSFLKIRAIAFCLINLFCLLWIVLLSIFMFYEWDTSDPTERPIVIVMLLTDTITLVILLILLILPFRPWLDAARSLFLLLAHIGVAGAFAFWNPSFHCPTHTPDSEGVCRLLNLYILVASWVIPVLLVMYAAGLALAMVRSPPQSNSPALERGSILPMMRPTSGSPVISYESYSEKVLHRGSTSEERRKHISDVSSRTNSVHNSLTKLPPAFFV